MNGRGNIGVGGNDPTMASNIQQTSNMVNPPAPPGAPQGMSPQAGPQLPQNEVATHLAAAYEALTRTGPTPENLAALQGFMASLQQLGEGMQGPAAGPPSTPGPPMGGPQMPMPGGQAPRVPLPPMG